MRTPMTMIVLTVALSSFVMPIVAWADPTFDRIKKWASFDLHQRVQSVCTNIASTTTVVLVVHGTKVRLTDVFANGGCRREEPLGANVAVSPICAGHPVETQVARPRPHMLVDRDSCRLESLLDLYRPFLVALSRAIQEGEEPILDPVQCRFEIVRPFGSLPILPMEVD